MWETLPDWIKIAKSVVIGLTFAVTVFVGWYFVNRITSRTIKFLRAELEVRRGV
jgi:hypothetical protein